MKKFIIYIGTNTKRDVIVYNVFKFIILYLNSILTTLLFAVNIIFYFNMHIHKNVVWLLCEVCFTFLIFTGIAINSDSKKENGDYYFFKTESYKEIFKKIENES